MKKLFNLMVFFVVLLGFQAFLPINQVFAAPTYGLSQTASTGGYRENQDFYSLLNQIVTVALGLLALVFFALTLYSGLRWMTARGNEDLTTRAKDTLEAAIIGLIVILMSYGLVRFLFGRLLGSPTNPAVGGTCTSDAECNFEEKCDLQQQICLPNN